MFTEDQLLPISALQHLRYCERRVALVHIEGLWAENRFTAEGVSLHRKAHDAARSESRPGLRTVRGMMLRSFTLGVFGHADVVELHVDGDRATRVTIVEYKRGRPKPNQDDRAFRLQLCAQALCLEEMRPGVPVDAAIYYGQARRREPVALDVALREETAREAGRLHGLIAGGKTPVVAYQRRKCDRCSMKPLCLPTALRAREPATAYVAQLVAGERGCELSRGMWE